MLSFFSQCPKDVPGVGARRCHPKRPGAPRMPPSRLLFVWPKGATGGRAATRPGICSSPTVCMPYVPEPVPPSIAGMDGIRLPRSRPQNGDGRRSTLERELHAKLRAADRRERRPGCAQVHATRYWFSSPLKRWRRGSECTSGLLSSSSALRHLLVCGPAGWRAPFP